MDVHRFILEHGAWSYLITFVWTFLEGETFVLFAGFAAAQGLLAWPPLVIAAWLGSFAGDQCYFWIGRRFGLRLLAWQPLWRERVDRALAWMRRYDAGFILTFRFVYGVRNVSSFALGFGGVGWRRFLGFNFIAAGLWAGLFVAIGYCCGDTLGRVAGRLAVRFSQSLLIVFAGALIAAHILNRLRRNWRARNRRVLPTTPPPTPSL